MAVTTAEKLTLVVTDHREIIVVNNAGEHYLVIKPGKYAAYFKTLHALYNEVDITLWPHYHKMVKLAKKELEKRINKPLGTNFRIEEFSSAVTSRTIHLVTKSSVTSPQPV